MAPNYYYGNTKIKNQKLVKLCRIIMIKNKKNDTIEYR